MKDTYDKQVAALIRDDFEAFGEAVVEAHSDDEAYADDARQYVMYCRRSIEQYQPIHYAVWNEGGGIDGCLFSALPECTLCATEISTSWARLSPLQKEKMMPVKELVESGSRLRLRDVIDASSNEDGELLDEFRFTASELNEIARRQRVARGLL